MPRTLTDDEIIEVLEDIVKNASNAQAKIAEVMRRHGLTPAPPAS